MLYLLVNLRHLVLEPSKRRTWQDFRSARQKWEIIAVIGKKIARYSCKSYWKFSFVSSLPGTMNGSRILAANIFDYFAEPPVQLQIKWLAVQFSGLFFFLCCRDCWLTIASLRRFWWNNGDYNTIYCIDKTPNSVTTYCWIVVDTVNINWYLRHQYPQKWFSRGLIPFNGTDEHVRDVFLTVSALTAWWARTGWWNETVGHPIHLTPCALLGGGGGKRRVFRM